MTLLGFFIEGLKEVNIVNESRCFSFRFDAFLLSLFCLKNKK